MVDVRSSPTLRTISFLIATCYCERSAAISLRGILGVGLFLLALVSVATAKYSGGSGTAAGPYQITTAADLIALGETPTDYDKHFLLTADIDLDPNLPGRKVFDKAVMPAFRGAIDGNGHTISHLTVAGGTYQLGLFGELASGGKVKDLGLLNVNIAASNTPGGSMYVGALVGYNEGSVIRCYVTGVVIVSGYSLTGGLVGRNLGGVTSSYSTCTVHGVSGWIGALVGYNDEDVTQCYATGSGSSAWGDVGGLVGHNSGTVSHSVWDMEASHLSASPGGVGLTTAEMMDPHMLGLNGFANDPTWVLDAGRDYPRLAWQRTVGQIIPEPDIGWLEGNGTPEVPYRIDTADQLIFLGRASAICGGHFVLDADIDLDPNLSDRRVFPQALIPAFTGVFDGNHHTISHLTITGQENLGLFDQIARGAEVRNLGVIHLNVTGAGLRAGGLAARNAGGVVCCYTSGLLKSAWSAGGLVGVNGVNYSGGEVTQCHSTVAVSGGSCVGGLVAYNWIGAVNDCYSSGAVSGAQEVGGLVGQNEGGAVTHCYSTGPVSGSRNIGGLVGVNYSAVTACFWDIQTSAQDFSAAGMGRTTAEMQTGATFLIWGTCGNEAIWTIDEAEDYPRLLWEDRPGEPIRMPKLSDLLLGSGMENDPFLIYAPEELNAVGLFPCEWDKHFMLMADVDLAGYDGKGGRPAFNIIGTNYETAFTGIFDGNSHTISHLTIRGTNCVGLFGVLASGGEVNRLGVVDVNVTGSGADVGGLVGVNYGAVTDCNVVGTVGGSAGVGGLAGYNAGSVTRCCSAGMVSGKGQAGCAGGLVGSNGGSVTHCYSIDKVSGNDCAGGLAGDNDYGASIAHCYGTGAVNGDGCAGGFVGGNGGVLSSCYSSGEVHGKSVVGGLVGSGSPWLAWKRGPGAAVTACFWDTETSGQATSAGGTGKTTAEMQTAKTFLDAG